MKKEKFQQFLDASLPLSLPRENNRLFYILLLVLPIVGLINVFNAPQGMIKLYSHDGSIIFTGTSAVIAKIVCTVVLLAILFISLVGVFGKITLIVTKKGFEYETALQKKREYEWKNVSVFTVRNNLLCFLYCEKKGAIGTGFRFTPPQLAELMNHWRQKAISRMSKE